jgi:hypothetical protein
LNHGLWRFIGSLDPDSSSQADSFGDSALAAGTTPAVGTTEHTQEIARPSVTVMNDAPSTTPTSGRIHPELKDLLNRILDVDSETRITIEDICKHPWLQSHQAAEGGDDDAFVETAAQRAAYTTEMQRRFGKYVATEASEVARTLSSAKDISVSGLSSDHCFEILRRYARRETGLIVTRADVATASASLTERTPSVGCADEPITFEVYRGRDCVAETPESSVETRRSVPIYRATLQPGGLLLEWVPHSIVNGSGELVNLTATLGEWYHFRETVTGMLAQLTPRMSRRNTPRVSRRSTSESLGACSSTSPIPQYPLFE